MPKCLFIGCSDAQLPYLRAVKALGYEAIVTDANDECPGVEEGDGYKRIGYDDINGMLDFAERIHLGPSDRVFTAAAHHAHEAAAAVAYQCGIPYPSPEDVDVAVCKMRIGEVGNWVGMVVPHYAEYDPRVSPKDRPPKDAPYYIKSDYGKSPRYCVRVEAGGTPTGLPTRRDRFYRRSLLWQDEVIGTHWRVVTAGSHVIGAFRRTTGDLWETSRTLPWMAKSTDIVQPPLVAKWDVVEDESRLWLLDLGIDPPQRLRIYHEARGEDFAMAYVRQHLTNDGWTLPTPEPGTIINMETRQCES